MGQVQVYDVDIPIVLFTQKKSEEKHGNDW
jgi:hypothetical protein